MKLCDIEISKVLQELGYDGECNRWYNHDGMLKSTHLVDDDVATPRLDDAAYWLKDTFGIVIWITYLFSGFWNPHLCDLNNEEEGNHSFAKAYKTYEEALEAALKKAIEIIKSR